MNRKLIIRFSTWYQPFVLAAMLVCGSAAFAQDATETESDEAEVAELDTLQVTGSRISRTDIEGPAPVIVITSEQLEKEGFTTMYEALRTLTQNSNFGQTEGQGNTFTNNANALDLRGLGPGRTLLLLDGRRITDYPLPYNNQSNLQSLDSLPLAAIERIEVIAGGASAIYGADAVAGVVNTPPYLHAFASPFATPPLVTVAVQTAMDGFNGGWMYTFGSMPASMTEIGLAGDEDQLSDVERSRATEQAAYAVFARPGVYPDVPCKAPTCR